MSGEALGRTYRVRIDDINYGGHMGNERALVVFQDARIGFLQTHGWTERDVGEGLGLILVEAGVRFGREVFLDDVLVTTVGAANLRRSGFDLTFSSARSSDGAEVFSGFTRMLTFHYGERKVRALPARLREVLEAHAGGSEGGAG